MALSKSDRLKLLKQMAHALEGEGWSIIDLTLQQFGFPTTDEWNSGEASYVIEMLKDASEEALLELAEHLEVSSPNSLPKVSADVLHPPIIASADTKTSYWEDGNLRVFVTHLSDHREKAAQLQTALEPYAMSSFVAHNDIHPTLEWQNEVETALSTCDLLVALIHPGFVESQWCDQEIGYALGRGVPVFTVKAGADPHGFVSRFQAIPGKGKTANQIAKQIFDAALSHRQLQPMVAEALVAGFIDSNSFLEAKDRLSHLESLKIWDASYSKRLEDAVEANSQIKGSFGVPRRVSSLIAKWAKAKA